MVDFRRVGLHQSSIHQRDSTQRSHNDTKPPPPLGADQALALNQVLYGERAGTVTQITLALGRLSVQRVQGRRRQNLGCFVGKVHRMQGTTVAAIEVKATDLVVGVCRDRVRLMSLSVADWEIRFCL